MKHFTLEYCEHYGSRHFYIVVESVNIETAIHDYSTRYKNSIVVNAFENVVLGDFRSVVYQDANFRVLYDSILDCYFPQYAYESMLRTGISYTYFYESNGDRIRTVYLSRAIEFRDERIIS